MEGGWRRSGGPNTALQLRAAIRELLQLRQFRTATRLLETCRIEEKGDVRSLWYEVHYMKLKEQLGKDSLTPVQRFRCRKRNPPPCHLCPEEIKTRNLPAEARQFLRAWAEGNNISPSVSEREQLIKETGLGKQQIYNWFANYRRRQKRISSQQERDFTRTTICHKRARKLLRRCPQEFSSAGGDTSADVPHDVKEEQAEDEQSRDTDDTAAQRPALSRLQCCCLGLSCDHLLLPEADPVTLLNTTASSYWCRSPEALNTVARTNMALCPCLSTTADLTRPSPVMHLSQPANPDGLIQYTLSGSKFERVSNLEQFYLTEELLNQDGLSLFSSSEKWQVSLPIFPNNPSQFHSSSDSFLSSGQSSDIWAQQKEELVPDGHLQRCLLMCPVDPGYSVLDASQIQPVGSINDAPVLDEGMVTAWAGYNALDTVKSAAKTEQVLCAVAGDEDETSRWVEREGLNLPSQWTLGAACLDAGPQNRDEHVEIDCRGFTHLKVETDENSSPEHSQIQQDAELDIAAQALIQLSQRPAGDPSRVKP